MELKGKLASVEVVELFFNFNKSFSLIEYFNSMKIIALNELISLPNWVYEFILKVL